MQARQEEKSLKINQYLVSCDKIIENNDKKNTLNDNNLSLNFPSETFFLLMKEAKDCLAQMNNKMSTLQMNL